MDEEEGLECLMSLEGSWTGKKETKKQVWHLWRKVGTKLFLGFVQKQKSSKKCFYKYVRSFTSFS